MAEVERHITPVFRVSFPNLFAARSYKGGAEKFGTSAIWTPAEFSELDKKRWHELLSALNDASLEKFKLPLKELPANIKRGMRDGLEKPLEGYGAGTKFANLTTQQRPGVVDNTVGGDGKLLPIGPEHGNESKIYAGCYCRATVNIYHYDNVGKGVAIGLMNLQFVKDGPRLDSRTDAADDFADDIDEAWMDQDDMLGEGSEKASADDDFLD